MAEATYQYSVDTFAKMLSIDRRDIINDDLSMFDDTARSLGKAAGNALKNSVALEVEPRLSNSNRFAGTSTKAWYLFASPQDAAMVMAFLQGKQSPTVEFFGLDADPNRLAATWRVYFDFGAALADHRAAYRAKGEA